MSLNKQKIFLIGLMGSGKSYWGRHLALHFRFPFLDLDKGIEMVESRSVTEIFAREGEAFFRDVEARTLRQLTGAYSKFVMSCGGGTACFHDNIKWMKQAGIVVWLNPPFEVLAQRLLSGREKRPLIKNAVSETEIIAILDGLMNSRLEFYKQSHLVMEDAFPSVEIFEILLKNA